MAKELGVVRKLKRIGFSSSTYLEAVAVLQNSKGETLNVVPLGFKLVGGFIVVRVYRGSRTYELVISRGASRGFICVTQDPRLFFYAVFDKAKALALIEKKRCCEAVVYFGVDSVELDEQRGYAMVSLRPVDVVVSRRAPRGFTRASAMLIEALVWFTKAVQTPLDRDTKSLYLSYVEMCVRSVYRSTSSGLYRSMARRVLEELKRFTGA